MWLTSSRWHPFTDIITREHRSKLLTRRVRAIMRVFGKNPNYLSGATPNITWDDSFIPPALYENLETERQKEKEREKEKTRESQKRKMEEQMAKEKAKVKQNDKEKAKETMQDLDDTEKPKRKWTREISICSDSCNDKDDTSVEETEPSAKRVKRKKLIDDVGIVPDSPPCRRCAKSKKECIPNGWPAACKSCRQSKMKCSLAKARNRGPNPNAIPNMNGDAAKPQTITSRLRKSIAELDDSSSEDEDVVNEDVVDEDVVDEDIVDEDIVDNIVRANSRRNFDLEHLQQQLKATQEELKSSQDELRITHQQLQIANSRVKAQQNLKEIYTRPSLRRLRYVSVDKTVGKVKCRPPAPAPASEHRTVICPMAMKKKNGSRLLFFVT